MESLLQAGVGVGEDGQGMWGAGGLVGASCQRPVDGYSAYMLVCVAQGLWRESLATIAVRVCVFAWVMERDRPPTPTYTHMQDARAA